ncbi:MAG TPA: DNA repair protein RecO [Longimicrobiaceae bacterium]|nr:DNA repair protein RecO [Longimicrobiaceae bacterium]
MPLVSARALILQAFPYSDTSKILRFYTLTHGLRSAIAKGAQRPKSRFGGLLEPFTEGDALIFLKEGRDLHTLSGFDLLRSRQSLGRDLTAFAGASLLAELLLRFGTEEPHPALFKVMSRSLDDIARTAQPGTEQAVLSGVWLVISLLGFQPELDACVTCGRALDPQQSTRFDAGGGGVACSNCRPHGRPLEASVRHELRRMLSGEPITGTIHQRATHRALLRTFLAAHLAHEHPFRSLDLLMQQLS